LLEKLSHPPPGGKSQNLPTNRQSVVPLVRRLEVFTEVDRESLSHEELDGIRIADRRVVVARRFPIELALMVCVGRGSSDCGAMPVNAVSTRAFAGNSVSCNSLAIGDKW
jgi:hypothetical protein